MWDINVGNIFIIEGRTEQLPLQEVLSPLLSHYIGGLYGSVLIFCCPDLKFSFEALNPKL
jgi:hypothetical protein